MNKRRDRPIDNESIEWQLYLHLRDRYNAVKALLDLKSLIGRLPTGPLKTSLELELNEILSMRKVELSKSELDNLNTSDSEEPPYMKFLPKKKSMLG